MPRKPNLKNLQLVLVEITKRVNNSSPISFFTLCKEYHLGHSTAMKLRYALLEADYYPDCKESSSKRMSIKKDGSWKFLYRNPTGSRNWSGLVEELDSIIFKMEECPKNQANPYYYKMLESATIENAAPLQKYEALKQFSAEELLKEILRRCQ